MLELVDRVNLSFTDFFRKRSSRFSGRMLFVGILSYICSSAVTLRRDKSMIYTRTSLSILLMSFILGFNNLFISFQDKGIGLFHGLFINTATTHIMSLFIFIISFGILQLNAFHNRKI